MSIKSALFAAITTVVLILALGNEWMVEQATEGDFARLTRINVVSQLQFQFWDMPSDFRFPTVVRLILLIVLAAVFGGIVGPGPASWRPSSAAGAPSWRRRS